MLRLGNEWQNSSRVRRISTGMTKPISTPRNQVPLSIVGVEIVADHGHPSAVGIMEMTRVFRALRDVFGPLPSSRDSVLLLEYR
jgi:hypothetical protein